MCAPRASASTSSGCAYSRSIRSRTRRSRARSRRCCTSAALLVTRNIVSTRPAPARSASSAVCHRARRVGGAGDRAQRRQQMTLSGGNYRVWLITGASSGLGLALAEAALGRGDRVIATARDPQRLDELAERYPGQGIAAKLLSSRAPSSPYPAV